MNQYTEYRNSTLSFLGSLKAIMEHGVETAPRGQQTKEILNATIVTRNPSERCIIVPHRNNNVFAQVAETLWMLAGHDDIEWLSYFLPRAADFSDNGRTWRGAYGPRLRNWNGADRKVDQIANVLNLLRKDPSSRQAVISIWEPSIDFLPGKDIPCNNWIHFLIRDGKLLMNLAQRSSDCMWGYSGIDTFSWSVLHQVMATLLDVEVGPFTHFISSFHVYDRHWGRAVKILGFMEFFSEKGGEFSTIYDVGIRPAAFHFHTFGTDADITNFDIGLRRIFEELRMVRQGVVVGHARTSNELFNCFADMLIAYIDWKEGRGLKLVLNRLMDMPEVDMKYAAIEYLARQDASIMSYLPNEIAGILRMFMV